MKTAAIAAACVVAVVLAGQASAGLVAHPRGPGLTYRAEAQRINLAHALYVCRHGGGASRRWSCSAIRWLRRELGETELALAARLDPIAAIRLVFGAYADEAIAVVRCETGGSFSTLAQNGQYLGLFQMGDYARGRYGHGSTPIAQARAAWRYFSDSGRGWGPWECKP